MEKAIPTAAVAAVGVTTVSNGAYSMLSPRLSVSAGVPAKVATEDSAENSPLLTKILCMLVVLLLFADQSLMAPNLSAIAAEFGFSDEEKDRLLGGQIAMAFFGVGAPASLAVGWLSDSLDRRKLFAIMAVLGELAAFSTLFVTNYWQLLVTRAVTGLAIGGGIPLVYSIMSDLLGASRRTEGAGAISITVTFGHVIGQSVAGFSGQSTSLRWRFPFVVLSVPCLVLLGFLYATTSDPPRGRHERALKELFRHGGEYKERPSTESLVWLARTPTFLLGILQGFGACIAIGVMSVFLTDFLFHERELSMESATLIVVVYKFSACMGQLIGSKVGQKLYNRGSRLQPLMMGLALVVGTAPAYLIITYTGGSFAAYLVLAMAAGFLTAVSGPNYKSMLMNVTLPSNRGSAFGLVAVADDLGHGAGPALVSFMVARWGRERAFSFSMLAWLVAAACMLLMVGTIERDERRVQSHLREYSKVMEEDPDRGEIALLSRNGSRDSA